MTGPAPALAIIALAAALVSAGVRQAGAAMVLALIQGACVAAALAVQGQWAGAALVALTGAAGMPILAARLPAGPRDRPPGWPAVAGGLVILALAVTQAESGPALALLLAGLWQVTTRRDSGARIGGLVTMQLGAVLAAADSGASLPLLMLAALPLPAALVLARAWLDRGRTA